MSAVLRYLPIGDPLILTHDPDGMLDDAARRTLSDAHGYTVLDEADPIRLRHAYANTAPPHLILTRGALNALPFDLCQQGTPVDLSLERLFPNLAQALVADLPAAARMRLLDAPMPAARLGEAATMRYLLEHVYNLDADSLSDPLTLIRWLSGAAAKPPLGRRLRARLLERLHAEPAYADWDLEALLDRPEQISNFLLAQLQARLGGSALGEAVSTYLVESAQVERRTDLPYWLRASLRLSAEDGAAALLREARAEETRRLLEDLRQALTPPPQRFNDWAALADRWATLTALRAHPEGELPPAEADACLALESRLDAAFADWLRRSYPKLAGEGLPEPHLLFHVPNYLASLRRKGQADRVALVVLDGMSLADWKVLWQGWQTQRAWRCQTRLLLAHIPTVTAVSRAALISGSASDHREAMFAYRQREDQGWEAFWAREGLGAHACALVRDPESVPDLTDIRALCAVFTAVDALHHSAWLGASAAQAALRRWRDAHAAPVLVFIQALLDAGFGVWLTSDHGNVAAVGVGQPREGLIALSRGLRTRFYPDRRLAEFVQRDFPETYLWGDDGVLPPDVWALLPHGRAAFAPKGEWALTHGGITLDEVFVPLVKISPEP